MHTQSYHWRRKVDKFIIQYWLTRSCHSSTKPFTDSTTLSLLKPSEIQQVLDSHSALNNVYLALKQLSKKTIVIAKRQTNTFPSAANPGSRLFLKFDEEENNRKGRDTFFLSIILLRSAFFFCIKNFYWNTYLIKIFFLENFPSISIPLDSSEEIKKFRRYYL